MSRSTSKAAAISATPWSDAELEARAKKERESRLAKLLGKLEKKQQQQQQTQEDEYEQEHKQVGDGDRRDERRRGDRLAPSTAASATSRQPNSNPKSSHSSSTARVHDRYSANSSPTILPPATIVSEAYTQQLLESRGKRSATSQARAGAAAIEEGSSVQMRRDPYEEDASRPYQSPNSRSSHPSSSPIQPPTSSPSSFIVASGGSMEERAAIRAYHRQQIQEQHAAREAAKQAEIAARAQAEADEIEAIKRAELQRKRDLKRAERDAAQARMRAAELESQKSLLATLHHQRARLLYFGWTPWRRLLEAARIKSLAMQKHAEHHAAQRFFRRWIAGMKISKQQKAELEQRKLEKAARYCKRRWMKRIMRQWFKSVLKRRRDMEGKRKYYLKTLLRNTFLTFCRNCIEMKRTRTKKLQRLESSIISLSTRVLERHAFKLWIAAVEQDRAQKLAIKKQQAVKDKVGGWLEEFRAQKARERGELPPTSSYEPSNTFSAFSSAPSPKLKVDLPIATPASLVSPSRYSPAIAAAIAPLISPSRYSALNHASASPQAAVVSPSTQGPSGASSAMTSASSSAARASSYSDFMSSLSPRSSQQTASASALPGRASSFATLSVEPTAEPTRVPFSSSTYSALNSPTYHAIMSPKQASTLSPTSTVSSDYQPRDFSKLSISPAIHPNLSSTSKYASVPPPAASPAQKASSSSSNPPSTTLKSVLSPTSKFGATLPNKSLQSSKTNSPGTLSGSNLATTLPVKKVSFEMGVGDKKQLAPSSNQRPASAKQPTAPPSASPKLPPPTSNFGFSLIQAAKAKAMELDALSDGPPSFGINGLNYNPSTSSSSAANSHLFHLSSTQTRPSSSIQYDTSIDDESGMDGFDQHLNLVLSKNESTQQQPLSTKSTRPASSPIKRSSGVTSSSSHPQFQQPSQLDSARSDFSAISTDSLSSVTSAATWSRTHSQPSVRLAEARAIRREQANSAPRRA